MCKKSQTKQTTTTTLPEWLTQASQQAVGQASELASRPFERYSGPRVAEFSDDQKNAFQQLRNMIAGAPNIGGEVIEGARKYANAPAQNITAQNITPETVKGNIKDIASYFNPNTEAALQPALRKIDEAAGQSLKRAGAAATSARAFGDARHGIVDSQIDANRMQAHGDTASQAYQTMWDKALGALSGDVGTRNAAALANANFAADADKTNAVFNEQALNRMLTGSKSMEELAQADQNRQLQQLQALLGTGALQQGNEQAKLNADFQEFLREYAHGPQMAQLLANITRSVPTGMTQTTVGQQPNNAGLGALGSLAGSALGSQGFWGFLSSLAGPASLAMF